METSWRRGEDTIETRGVKCRTYYAVRRQRARAYGSLREFTYLPLELYEGTVPSTGVLLKT